MRINLIALAGTAVMLNACGDGIGPNAAGTGNVSLSFSTLAGGQLAQSPGPSFMRVAADTLTDGENELVITKAEIVLREIELEKISDDACDSLADSLNDDHDGCEKFETGPILLDLPLDGAVDQIIEIAVDTGTYDEIEFEIHKVSNDDPEDATFRQNHPDMVGRSIRVQGSFNGQPFTFETDIDEEQEYDIIPPLVIDEMMASTNVTVRIDLDAWFRAPSGALFNPQSANKGGDNESLASENIKHSFEAFEDHDADGDDDESGS
jgi:hypothetical protein